MTSPQEKIDRLVREAIDLGASVGDINNILSRTGQAHLIEETPGETVQKGEETGPLFEETTAEVSAPSKVKVIDIPEDRLSLVEKEPIDIVYPQEDEVGMNEEVAKNIVSGFLFPRIEEGVDLRVLEGMYNEEFHDITTDPESYLEGKAAKEAEERNQALMDYISALPAEQFEQEGEDIKQIAEEQKQEEQSLLAPYMLVANAIAPNKPKEVKEEIAFRYAAGKMISDYMQTQEGLFDTVMNYAGFLIPDITWDLSGTDITPDTVRWFQTLESEQKLAVFQILFSQAINAQDDNQLKVAMTMMSFLNPDGAEELKSILDFDKVGLALSYLDAAAIAKFGLNVFKAGKLIKQLRDAGDVSEAGKINAGAVADQEFAFKVGKDQEVAFRDASFFKNEHLHNESTDGIHNESMVVLQEQDLNNAREVRKLLSKTFDEEFTLKAGDLYDPDKVAVARLERAEEFRNELQKIYDKAHVDIGEVKIIPEEDGDALFEVSLSKTPVHLKRVEAGRYSVNVGGEIYDIVGKRGAWTITSQGESLPVPERVKSLNQAKEFIEEYAEVPTKIVRRFRPTVDEVGVLQVRDISPGIFSPKQRLKDLDTPGSTHGYIVENAELVASTSYKYRKLFNQAKKMVWSPIKGRSKRRRRREVEDVLLHGDELGEDGTRFTRHQLEYEGIELRDGRRIRLDDQQRQAYYSFLELSDWGAFQNNILVREKRRLKGYKNIDILDGKVYGKPVNPGRIQEVKGEARANAQYWDIGEGVKPVSNLSREELEKQGKILVRFDEPVMMRDGEGVMNEFTLAVVKSDLVKELPEIVVPLRNAYVPDLHVGVKYVVKEHMFGKLNGIKYTAKEPNSRGFTDTMFSSKDEAVAYAARKNRELEKEGIPDTEKVYKVHDDSDINFVGALDRIGEHSPFSTAGRSTRDIRFGIERSELERLGPIDAMGRYLDHMANKIPMNEWRLAEERRFVKTVNAQENMKPISNFNDPLVGGDTEVKFLETLRDYLKQQFRIPSKGELQWEATTRKIAEWFERHSPVAGKLIHKSVLKLGDTNPIAAARASAFHPLLGWFNISQLLIQANGASIAYSLFPVHGTKAVPRAVALRFVMFSDNEEYIRKVWRIIGVDPEEGLRITKAFQKSGLAESIKNTADYRAATRNYSFGAEAVRKVADKGLIFYREGELFHRGMAYNVAYLRWLEKNPGKELDKAAELAIFRDAQNLSMNLSVANRANWQNGLLSLPTQFLQVQAKFIENILPESLGGTQAWTPGQKFRLLIMQGVFYGAAGVPLGNVVLNWAAGIAEDELTDIAAEYPEASEFVLTILRQGIAGYIIGGGELNIAGRAALASDIERMLMGVFTEEVELSRLLIGAFGEVLGRGHKAYKFVEMLTNTERDFKSTDILLAMNKIAQITSTWNNANSAYFMYIHSQYLSRNGRVVFEDPTMTEIWGKLGGFSPARANDINNVLWSDRRRSEAISEQADLIWSLSQEYLKFVEIDPEAAKDAANAIQYNLRAMDEVTPNDAQEVRRILFNRISNPKTKEEEAMKRLFENFGESATSRLEGNQILLRELTEETE